MRFTDTFEETYTALSANKVRSGLTMLGIVIGISSVIALVSIGQGAQASIQNSIESIGANLVMVMPGAQRTFGGGASVGRGTAESLTVPDANAIESQITNISAVVRDVTSRKQVTAKGTNTNTSIIGTEPSYLTAHNVQISEGNFISDSDVTSATKVAILGPTTETDLFGTDDAVGQTIRISGIEFKVIGITVSKGGSGFTNADDAVYIPYTTAQHYISGNQYLSEIDVTAASSDVSTQVQNDITTLLLARHTIANPANADFNTLNEADIVATASSITGTFTILLGAVAGISLLVGGIGIMNMMLTTVTERTKEIGLRKSIGAKKNDINIQFLMEAIMLTFIGGFIGVVLGWGISFIVNHSGLVSTKVSAGSILLAFGVSALIGIVFGYYPARRASNLNPIDALRYE